MKHRLILNLMIVFGLLVSPFAGLSTQAPAVQAAPSAVILYVEPGASGGCGSWGDACELQTALGLAEPDDQVWVKQGLYTPSGSGDETASFNLESGVALYGGFDGTESSLGERDPENNLTVLSGDIDNNDDTTNGVVLDTDDINGNNSYHVVVGSGVDAGAVLDGFTITGGKTAENTNSIYIVMRMSAAVGCTSRAAAQL